MKNGNGISKKLVKLALVVGALTLSLTSIVSAQGTGAAPSQNLQSAQQRMHRHRGEFKLVKACLAQQGITPPQRTVGQRLAFSSLDETTRTAMKACFSEIKNDMQSCLSVQGVTSLESRQGWSQLDTQAKEMLKTARKTCRSQILAAFNSSQSLTLGTSQPVSGSEQTNRP